MTIIVNGRQASVKEGQAIDYSEALRLAGVSRWSDGMTVSYRMPREAGTLCHEGSEIRACEGLVINVHDTSGA